MTDENGNTVTEYEAGESVKTSGATVFTFGDSAQLIHHLHMMGQMDEALVLLESAVQFESSVLIEQEGKMTVVVEDTTIADLSDAIASANSEASHSETGSEDEAVDDSIPPVDSDPLIAYDGDMFEFDEDVENDPQNEDNTTALTAQAVDANTPTDSDAGIGDDAIVTVETDSEALPENTNSEIKLIHDDGA